MTNEKPMTDENTRQNPSACDINLLRNVDVEKLNEEIIASLFNEKKLTDEQSRLMWKSNLHEALNKARQQGIEIGKNDMWEKLRFQITTDKESYEQGKKDMIKELRESKQIPEIMRSDVENAIKAERERIIKLLENEHLRREDILSKLKEAKPKTNDSFEEHDLSVANENC